MSSDPQTRDRADFTTAGSESRSVGAVHPGCGDLEDVDLAGPHALPVQCTHLGRIAYDAGGD